MASKRKTFDLKAPPDRWLNCPRKSEGFIAGKICFKTYKKNKNLYISSQY